MWESADRHPVRAWLVFALLSLIIADGARRTLSTGGPRRESLLMVPIILVGLAALPMSVIVRRWPDVNLRTQLRLAYAFCPIIVGVAATAAGAALWSLWAWMFLSVGLAGWWAWDMSRSSAAA
jgi:hypothetical protein